ncbi:MAG: Mur ligase family protein, partial [Methyloceanibacter sp.]
MTLGELIGPEALLPAPWLQVPILGLTADSRAVRPGYLFAALPGTRTDGSRFIAEALARGAAAILMPQGGAHAVNGTPFDGTSFSGTPVVEDANPRRRLALIAARFFGVQPEIAVAVTGTNGKTSVASFTRQLWEQQGLRAASLGTVGVVGPLGMQSLAHTTPDPVELHHILASLAKSGVTHLALEASSHGLEQRRIDGVVLAAGAFTNISRDHLDYHPSFEAYFAEKLRLFGELLPPGAAAVIDVDSEAGLRVTALAKTRGLAALSVGREGEDLRLVSSEQDGFGQHLVVEHKGG